MSSVQQKLNAVLSSLDSQLSKYPKARQFEAQTKIPKTYAVAGFAGLYVFCTILNFGGIGQLLANFAAVVVPAYYSLSALETKTTTDDTHYLTYWVIYAFFSVIEFWSRTLVYFIPFWWLLKMVFFLWLSHPGNNGCHMIYSTILRPFAVRFLGISSGPSSALKEKVNLATEPSKPKQV